MSLPNDTIWDGLTYFIYTGQPIENQADFKIFIILTV